LITALQPQADDLSASFTRRNKLARITEILDALLALNQARHPSPAHYAPT
jgi:hypothetical protein